MLQPKLTKNAAVQHCFHALIRGSCSTAYIGESRVVNGTLTRGPASRNHGVPSAVSVFATWVYNVRRHEFEESRPFCMMESTWTSDLVREGWSLRPARCRRVTDRLEPVAGAVRVVDSVRQLSTLGVRFRPSK